MWFYDREMCPKDADRMANSVDPDQTAPSAAVWSGSTLFAETCLYKNSRSLHRLKLIKAGDQERDYNPNGLHLMTKELKKEPAFQCN